MYYVLSSLYTSKSLKIPIPLSDAYLVGKDYTIDIDIYDQGLNAKLKVTTLSAEVDELELDDLIAALKERGIVYGINDELLQKIVDEKIVNEWIIVATGDPPLHGEDGRILFHFNTDGNNVRIEEDENGKINIRELNLIQNVNKGDILCEMIPAKPGVSGLTVNGKEIPSKNGKDVKLPPGKNTIVSEDGKMLLSAIDGMVFWDGSKVVVEPVYAVDKVDSSVGNIRFNGSVIVNGEVGDGFEIHAKDDVSVAMSVGRVIIEAGGDITIAGGIFGHKKGKIIAGKDVKVKFAQDAYIEAEGTIVVEDYILNSDVKAKGPVIVKGNEGWIAGSNVVSEMSIYTHTVGKEGAPIDSKLIIGNDPKILLEREELYDRVEARIKDFLKLKSSLLKLRKMRSAAPLGKDQEALYKKILGAIESVRSELVEQKKAIESITSRLKRVLTGHIYIAGIINEGASIMIGNARKDILTPKTSVQFHASDDEITEEEFSLPQEIKKIVEKG
ncbi:MAG TPA: DUF342 domain-containing protein [Deltaproteobacteria bacterium]|nr:DUF342 domain-containing protein [Deltaproteobacteria bacterium]